VHVKLRGAPATVKPLKYTHMKQCDNAGQATARSHPGHGMHAHSMRARAAQTVGSTHTLFPVASRPHEALAEVAAAQNGALQHVDSEPPTAVFENMPMPIVDAVNTSRLHFMIRPWALAATSKYERVLIEAVRRSGRNTAGQRTCIPVLLISRLILPREVRLQTQPPAHAWRRNGGAGASAAAAGRVDTPQLS